jgi:DNA-binding response OmpR family regulator
LRDSRVKAAMIRIEFVKLRFLLVEDNANMRSILRTLLLGFGARDIQEAEDGVAGLDLFVAHNPDIVIADWAMPNMDGIELTRRIRSAEGKLNVFVPILILTAHSERRHVLEARDAGATEFLCKPISARGLYERIANIVLNPRPFVRTGAYFGPERRRAAGEPEFPGEERRVENEAPPI